VRVTTQWVKSTGYTHYTVQLASGKYVPLATMSLITNAAGQWCGWLTSSTSVYHFDTEEELRLHLEAVCALEGLV